MALRLAAVLASACAALATETREEPEPHVPVILPPAGAQPVGSPPVAVTAASGLAVATGQIWAGRYTCTQGPTELTLRIGSVRGTRVDAIAELAAGRWALTGTFDPANGILDLQPTRWIDEAAGIAMVGLYGTVASDGVTYEGRVTDATCRSFSLRRAS